MKKEINIDDIGATYFSGELAKVGAPEPKQATPAKGGKAAPRGRAPKAKPEAIGAPYTDTVSGEPVQITAPDRAETRSKRFELKLTPSMFTKLQETADGSGVSVNEVITQMIAYCLGKGE